MECLLNPGVPCDNIMNYAYIIWFAFGIFLIALEFFIPGVFIIFFGIGSIVTSGLHYLFNFRFTLQLVIWIASSFAILLFGAKFLKDLFPSDQSYEPTMRESVEGRIVSVIRTVHVGRRGGRISFQGTDWDAISTDVEIPKGSFAKIVERDNLTFHLQAASQEEVETFLNSIKKIEEED